MDRRADVPAVLLERSRVPLGAQFREADLQRLTFYQLTQRRRLLSAEQPHFRRFGCPQGARD